MKRRQAIVLAAGAGTRFGGGKLLAEWRGRPLILAAVERALASPVDEVVVVLGADAEPMQAALKGLADPRLRLVHATHWCDGLAASLRAGIDALPPKSEGFLLFLGDMPLIPPELPAQVLNALTDGVAAVQPFHGGMPAHPVGFSSTLYEDLRHLRGDRGAARLLGGRADVVRIAASVGAVLDIDRREDL
jgi:molybdenum cofactor cytidylyltransferase